MKLLRDSRSRSEPDKPPRPPGFRPPAEDIWEPGFGSSHMAPRGMDGDPCGPGGPVLKISSDEKDGAGA